MGFEQLGKKLMRLGQDTKSGVQKMGESYQINSKISDAKKALDQYYRAIGEKVYQDNSETPLEGMEEEFAAVKEALDNIAEYTEQLNKVKGVTYCPECGKEAARGEKFCSDCGAKLPENQDDIAEKMKQDAKEAASEAGDIVNDVVDKAKGFVGNVAGKADAFVKGVASKVSSAEDAAEDVVEEAAEVVEETAEDVADVVKDAAEEAADAAEDITE